MAKAQRIDKLEREREALEGEYRIALVAALRECAEGRWGLFEVNKGLLAPTLEQRYRPESVSRLDLLGDEVTAARMALGYPGAMPEMVRLRELRQRSKGANALGEQRQAQAWLHEIEGELAPTLSPEGRGDDDRLFRR